MSERANRKRSGEEKKRTRAPLARRGGRLAPGNDGTSAAVVRTACVPRDPAFTGEGYLVRGLAVDSGFDCFSPLFAAWAVFASAPAGAGWCDLSPPFAIVLTPFHLAWRSALACPAVVFPQLCCQDGYVASAKGLAVSPVRRGIERHITDWTTAFAETPSAPCLSAMGQLSSSLQLHSWPTPWPSSAYRLPRTRWSSSATRGRATRESC